MRVIRRGLMVGVCILLCCIACSGALADAGKPTLVFGNEKDIVQDVPEDQRVVFEEFMKVLQIAPPYYSSWRCFGSYHGMELGTPYKWDIEKLIREFPVYKAIRYRPQISENDVEYIDYVTYECTDGSTVFLSVQNKRVCWVYSMQSRSKPEEFETV